jgi:hypothetical protein
MQHIKIPFKLLKSTINKVFPEYRGRKLSLVVHNSGSMTLTQTYWDSGCRSYYAGLDLSSGQFGHLRGVNVFPSFSQVEGKEIPLNDHLAVIEHRYSGRSQWIWLHIHPDALSLFPQSNSELTES